MIWPQYVAVCLFVCMLVVVVVAAFTGAVVAVVVAAVVAAVANRCKSQHKWPIIRNLIVKKSYGCFLFVSFMVCC